MIEVDVVGLAVLSVIEHGGELWASCGIIVGKWYLLWVDENDVAAGGFIRAKLG
jgi:hypothetical protein